ncbi:MAG: RnfABCDGE type electron transport complex subunit B [Candidatus Omnitrophica bacterium]|nr:RnfABCDGE type electron transport complex subunit B [Candidatus Omnitrophota bacterium]
MEILIPVLVLGSLGLIFGISLAFASQRLAVKSDPRLERIQTLLPGANCGACGSAGCLGFAERLLGGQVGLDACRVTEEKAKAEIAKILGKKIERKSKTVAFLHCNGGRRVKDRFIYYGIEDCVAVNLILAGQKECGWGCLGFGTCVEVCPFGAISMGKEVLPVVDFEKCKGCGKCVQVCPKKLFTLIPITSNVYVACSSHDLGKDTREVCTVGCVGCKRCQEVCPVDAIIVIDNLATIDYNKCNNCGECVRVCPTKAILIRR